MKPNLKNTPILSKEELIAICKDEQKGYITENEKHGIQPFFVFVGRGFTLVTPFKKTFFNGKKFQSDTYFKIGKGIQSGATFSWVARSLNIKY